MPRFSDDDVVDFMVLEAMTAKGSKEEAEQRARQEAERERAEFRASHRDWRPGQ